MKSFHLLGKIQEPKNWSHVTYTVPRDQVPAHLSTFIPFFVFFFFRLWPRWPLFSFSSAPNPFPSLDPLLEMFFPPLCC